MSETETIEALDNDVLVLARELRDKAVEVKRLREALHGLLECCEKHPAFQKPGNLITAGRVRAARDALKLSK